MKTISSRREVASPCVVSRVARADGRLGMALLALILLFASTTAVGQEQAEPALPPSDPQGQAGKAGALAAGTIIVTGTAIPVEREKISNTLTVIEGKAIKKKHTAYLQDVLREVPGVAVSQGGSFGSPTQVRIAVLTAITCSCWSTGSRFRRSARARSICPRCGPTTSTASRCCAGHRAASTARTRSPG